MKTRIIRIGNSRGLRIPKPLLEQAGLDDEVELSIREGALVIEAIRPDRTGWADAARRLADQEPGLLDEPTPTAFDDEWTW